MLTNKPILLKSQMKPVSYQSFGLFYKTLLFYSNVWLTTVLRGRYRDVPYAPCPHPHTQVPHYQCPSPQWYACFYLLNIHWYVMTTLSPSCTLGSTLGVVHSMGFDKYKIIRINCDSIIRSSVIALKILCSVSLPLPSPFPSSPSCQFSPVHGWIIIYLSLSYGWTLNLFSLFHRWQPWHLL